MCKYIYIYTLAVSPILGVADYTKKTTKTMGVLLRSSSNDEGPSCAWMALLEQHRPSSPVFHNLTSLHRCHLPYFPYHRVASIRQPRGNSKCQSELHHNRSPIISIPSKLTCLPHIHPPIIQGSLYSVHPPKMKEVLTPSVEGKFNLILTASRAVISVVSKKKKKKKVFSVTVTTGKASFLLNYFQFLPVLTVLENDAAKGKT